MQGKAKTFLTTESTVSGFRISELLGMIIMLVPFVISIRFNHIEPGAWFLFIQLSPDRAINIQPGLLSTLCAAVFYASLIARYEGIFRANNLIEALISTVRTFLNCWVISSLIATVIPTETLKDGFHFSFFFENIQVTLLLLALLLSWLGMKTIARYSWILFIIAAWNHLLIVNSIMNMLGAVFMLTFALSLFLQIKDYSLMTRFYQDFRCTLSPLADETRTDMQAAANDCAGRIKNPLSESSSPTSAHATSSVPPEDNVQIDLNSLDINGDGVFDKKDILLLHHNESDKQ